MINVVEVDGESCLSFRYLYRNKNENYDFNNYLFGRF